MIKFVARDFEDRVIGEYYDYEEAISAFQAMYQYFDRANASVFVDRYEIHFTECIPEYDGLLLYKYVKFNNSFQRFLKNGTPKLILHYITRLRFYDPIRFSGRTRFKDHESVHASG